MKIAIVIAAYNEEDNVDKVLNQLAWYEKESIIVVDDGSQDRTATIVKNYGAILLRHKTNQGKGMAHRTAFNYVMKQGYDGVITLDADGQHDPEEANHFLERIDTADILVGTRNMTVANMPLLRYWTNRVTSLVVSLIASQRVFDSQSGFRYISVEVLGKIPLRTSRFQTESEILIKAGRMGFKIAAVPISTIYKKKRSYINPFIDTGRFIVLAVRSLFE